MYVYIYILVFFSLGGGGVSPTQNHQLNQLPFKVDNGCMAIEHWDCISKPA